MERPGQHAMPYFKVHTKDMWKCSQKLVNYIVGGMSHGFCAKRESFVMFG